MLSSAKSTDVLSSGTADHEDEDDLDFLGIDLLAQMDIEDLIGMRKIFPQSSQESQMDNREGLSLSKPDFIKAMNNMAGNSELCQLFDTLDIDNTGYLKWEKVLDAIIEKTRVSPIDIGGNNHIDSDVLIHCISHCRGEPIVKIVPLETETTFCYAVVSRFGRVGVTDGEFNLLDGYKLGLKPDEGAVRDFNEFDSDEHTGRQHRRSLSTFLTDVIFIADTYALLFAASDRSLHLYDATGLVHVPLCRIIGIPNIPTCLDYHSSRDDRPSLLLIGDDHGDVIVMRFHQARNTLFKKKHPDKLDTFHWMELNDQSEYITYKIYRAIHNDSVRQIKYCQDNDTVLSCSSDPKFSLVARHVNDRREPYLFKVPQGVRCFHQDRFLRLLVTGSADHVVRLWNPVMAEQPLASLYGHHSAVVDVRILCFIAAIISIEAKGFLKWWDIHNECCMFSLSLDFPVYKIPGKKLEYGARSIFPGPSRIQELLEESRIMRSSKEAIQSQSATRASMSGSNLNDSTNLIYDEGEEWQRDSVLVVCCNYIAVLPLKTKNMQIISTKNHEAIKPAIMPPPTNEHYASAPSPWRSAESARTPRGSTSSKSTKSTDSTSSTSLPLKGKEAMAAVAPVKDIHKRRTQHRIKQEQMQMLVQQGAPHLALDLHPLQPICFSRPLPITTRMREKGIDVSDPDRLMRSRILRDSTTMSVTQGILSGASSAKSSKSSKSASIQKKTTPVKSRVTPDWFKENTQCRQLSSNKSSVSETAQ